uniref:ubiquitin carboxyl-terminal hydrolase 23 n=1 Tax=Erigeron canadensis TaxID=72917 RepID=UPI001CB9109A|nr:ubiquitin carboxyl-terminal hydrolase 23 [Erigeron canadensis]
MAAESLTTLIGTNLSNSENPAQESLDKSPFRRIQFHPARKPFNGFNKGGADDGFQLETLNPTKPGSKNVSGNEKTGGSDCVGISGKKRDAFEMENGVDPELSFGITFRRIGAGLENLGNTCFLNSVLQCLTYTEPLAAYLQSGKHQVTCRKAGFCALCAIQKHVSRALQLSGRSLAPKDLVSNLRCISRTFRNSRQEDAHEYMVNLLESMHKCCLPTGVPSESQSAYDKSLVHKIFGGKLRSQVKCMQCNYCSNKFDPFLDLSLEILKADNLYKAFANFTAKEQLDGGAKQYQCQQCKQKVKALKQLTIHKAPNVLTVHLKRFGSQMSGQKIDKKVLFGSTLDLTPFVTGPNDGDLKYTLYGVLVHAGWSTHSGHYYCFVRTSSGMWYSLDDNRVYQVSEKKVFEQKAYMLFYFRDRKIAPLKKTSDVVHQKDKAVINGTLDGSSTPKEGQTKTGLSNGSLNVQKSVATVAIESGSPIPVAPKETQMNTNLINGSLNDPHSLATVGIERSGISSVAPKETQTNTSLSIGALSSHKTSVTVDTVGNGPLDGAPEQTYSNTSLTNGSLNAHKSSVTVGTRENASSNGAPDLTHTNTSISNIVSINQKSSYMAGSMTDEISNGALEQTQKTEGPVLNSNFVPNSELTTKGKSEHSTIQNATTVSCCKPLTTSVDTAIKMENHAMEVGVSESSRVNSGRDGQIEVVATTLLEPSGLPKMESCMEEKTLGRKTHKKAKNFLKCRVMSMKFSSNVLMGTSLNQRKKKKHKQSKRLKNVSQEDLVNEGPSTSINVKPLELVKLPVENGFKENSVLEGSSVKIEALKAVKCPFENGFKERVNIDGAVLATSDCNGDLQRDAPKGSNHLDVCRGASKQKDLVRMLTRGLEDRVVPRWDEEDSTRSQRGETEHDLTIGYIGDDWDYIYDQGRRKKVRMSRTQFDGENPFQNIANERLKSHAGKQKSIKGPSTMMKKQFNKSRSGNGPCRT